MTASAAIYVVLALLVLALVGDAWIDRYR